MAYSIQVAQAEHLRYAAEICAAMAAAAKIRGTGIAQRQPAYIEQKIQEGKAVIALGEHGQLAGFCYIEHWEGRKFVANSGLIVTPEYQGTGLASKIKAHIFELSRKRYPQSKIFGITTSPAVMHINSNLGYRPVPLYELTQDEAFWRGCQSCPNYDILQRTHQRMCLCTGMIYQPNSQPKAPQP